MSYSDQVVATTPQVTAPTLTSAHAEPSTERASAGSTAKVIESKTPSKNSADAPIVTEIEKLVRENETFELKISQLQILNQELRQVVDSRHSSPSQKRLLVEELERTFDISLGHACRLVNLARSSFWYRPAKPFQLSAKMPRNRPLTELDRVRLLKSLSRQLQTRCTISDEGTVAFIETSLRVLGLRSAAGLARVNLKLAMEVFDRYVELKKL